MIAGPWPAFATSSAQNPAYSCPKLEAFPKLGGASATYQAWLINSRSPYKTPMQYWLVKQEPSAYSWNDFVTDKRTAWTGVRNFQARNNLAAMRRGDAVLFYHSVSEKSVVGIASVAKTAYPDPTAHDGNWLCVDLIPKKTFLHAVPLSAIKSEKSLDDIPLIRNSRLSVVGLTKKQFDTIAKMGGVQISG